MTFEKIKKAGNFEVTTQKNSLRYEKKIFTKVELALSIICPNPKGHLWSRLNTFYAIITGLLLRKKVDMESIGNGFVQDIQIDSRRVNVKRFFENKHISYDCFYQPYIYTILQQLFAENKSSKELILAIDGTTLGNKHAALAISFLYEEVSLPLCWLVRKGGKGHFKEAQHIELLEKAYQILQPIIPSDYQVVLLGDGEFDGADLQLVLGQKFHWNYVLRTSCDCLLFENQEDAFRPKDLTVMNGDFHFFEQVGFGANQKITTNFTLWHQKQLYQEPIPLISNLDDPRKITQLYQKRYRIERLFKGMKSSGFNIHQTRLTKIPALEKLILAVSIAYILMICFAKQNAERAIITKITRIRKQNVLSPIVLALRILNYCMENSIEFFLSFQMSKNLRLISHYD